MFLKVVLKKVIFALSYLIFAFCFELIIFSMLNLGMPKYFLFDISILFFLTAILFVIPGTKGQIIFSGIFLFIQGALGFVNSVLYKIDGSFFSISMLKTGIEGIAAFNFSFIDIKFTLIILGFIISALVVLILINKFLKTRADYKVSFILMLITVCIITQFFSFGLFKLQLSELYPMAENKGNIFLDDLLLYDTLEIKYEALKKFGSFGFYFRDLQNALSVNRFNSEEIEKLRNYLSESDMSINSPYHGISKANNVIMIMCESLEWYAISDELTPNLYNLKSNNIFNDKFYSNNKTNVSEGLGFLGSYPKKAAFSKDYTTLKTENPMFTTPFSLPYILKAENYTSKYFHDFDGDFYGRSSTHKNIFGFDDFIDIYEMRDGLRFGGNALEPGKAFGDWVLDSQMFSACINEIAPNDGSKFFSFITTITMHGPYDGNIRLKNNVNKIKNFLSLNNRIPNIDISLFNEKQKEKIINYIAAAMDLDKAVGVLMEQLNANTPNGDKLIDNTTVILYSDHWAYYQELNYLAKNLPLTELYNPELYRVPFIMIDKKLQKEVDKRLWQGLSYYNINTYMSAHDIVPTVLDLLGYTYNNKLFLGKSILLEEVPYSCMVSHLTGYFNDKLFTYNGVDFLYEANNITRKEKNDFKNYLIEFFDKQSYMEIIYLLKDADIEFSFSGVFIAKKLL